MAYSPASQGLLLFGGFGTSPGSLGDTWLTAPNVPATFTTFGNGCSGAGGTPTLAAVGGDVPHLGQSFDMQITNLPTLATVVVGVVGLSTTMNNGPLGTYPLPTSLSSLGMIGCTQYVSDDATFFMLSLSSTLNWSIAIPADAGLVGFAFNVQGAVFDPAANPFGVTATNGGTAQIGS